MARNALAKFGMAAVFIQTAKPASSAGMADHWVVQITTTDRQTRLVEATEADDLTAALRHIGEHREASIVEEAANDVRVRNRPTAWSLGP